MEETGKGRSEKDKEDGTVGMRKTFKEECYPAIDGEKKEREG